MKLSRPWRKPPRPDNLKVGTFGVKCFLSIRPVPAKLLKRPVKLASSPSKRPSTTQKQNYFKLPLVETNLELYGVMFKLMQVLTICQERLH
jgi:hypothetical protein